MQMATDARMELMQQKQQETAEKLNEIQADDLAQSAPASSASATEKFRRAICHHDLAFFVVFTCQSGLKMSN